MAKKETVKKPSEVLQGFQKAIVLAIAVEMQNMREITERTHELFAALAKASGLDIS